MIVSAADAFDLMKKWRSESTPLLAYVGINESVVIRLLGVISDLSADGFIVSKYEGPDRKGNQAEMAIGFHGAKEFDYRDMREAPLETRAVWGEYIAGILAFKLPVGSCLIHELQTPS
jgi:hypothetical protein